MRLAARHVTFGRTALLAAALALAACGSGGSGSSSSGSSTSASTTSSSGGSTTSTSSGSGATGSGSGSGSTSSGSGSGASSSGSGSTSSSGSTGSGWSDCSPGDHSCASGCCPWVFVDTGFGTSDAAPAVTFDDQGLPWWTAFSASTPWAGIPSSAGSWTQVQVATSTANYGEGASMVSLGASGVGVAWTTTEGFYWSRSLPDGGFVTSQLPGGLPGNSFQEQVVRLDRSGAPHVAQGLSAGLPDGGALNELTYLRPLDDGGAQIDGDFTASSDGQNVPDVDLAYAPDGTPRLVMFEDNALVYVRGQGDGGFVVTPLTGFGDLPTIPALAVDPSGTSHLMFSARDAFPDGGKEWHLRHAEGEDGTWSIETVDAAGFRLAPSLQIGADGELQAAYLEPVTGYYRVWYARRVAGTWHVGALTSPTELVTGEIGMVLDPAGNPALMLNEGSKLYLVRW